MRSNIEYSCNSYTVTVTWSAAVVQLMTNCFNAIEK